MKKFIVTWLEYHSQEIETETTKKQLLENNEERLFTELGEYGLSSSDTYDDSKLLEVEELKKEKTK